MLGPVQREVGWSAVLEIIRKRNLWTDEL